MDKSHPDFATDLRVKTLGIDFVGKEKASLESPWRANCGSSRKKSPILLDSNRECKGKTKTGGRKELAVLSEFFV